MNGHAIVACLYVRECVRVDPFAAMQDMSFVRLLIDLDRHYRREFDAVSDVLNAIGSMEGK